MDDLPPLMRDQRKIDRDHLNLLAIFHFVGAAFAVIGLLFLFGHYELMHFVLASTKAQAPKQNDVAPEQFFAIFRWFYLIFAIWFAVSLVLNVGSAILLKRRKWRGFSLFVAGIDCLHIPFGTTLGVFTIFVLIRPSVREAYESAAAGSQG